VGAGPSASAAALQGAALVLAHGAPHTGVLAGAESPLEARLGHRAAAAYLLGFFDLYKGGAGIADREEQLGVLVTAGSAVAPVHAVHSFFKREAMTPLVNGFTM
jgi:hypothetical protein